MADRIDQLRTKAADSEKITINLGHVDLGHDAARITATLQAVSAMRRALAG